MTARARIIATILVVAVLLAASITLLAMRRPTEPPLQVSGSPFTLSGPIRSYWEANGGLERLGPPRSALLWQNGRYVQLFEQVALLVEGNQVRSAPQPANWRTAIPAELLEREAAPQRTDFATNATTAQPLLPLDLKLSVPAYSGPMELRLYDARNQPAGLFSSEIRAGSGTAIVLPGGALGPQTLVALIDGRIAGVHSNLFQLDATSAIATNSPRYEALFVLTRSFLARNTLSYELNGEMVRGYRSPDSNLLWLRDHTYQARAARSFDADVTSLLAAFRRAQLADGSFPDYLAQPERGIPARRMPVEADVEYLYVQAVYEAWQATGDDAWLQGYLPSLRRALAYIISDPLRWDAEWGLVRRPYTIDTWDFEYGPTTLSPEDNKPAPRHWIDANTRWGIFHGDNTGLARALRLMARIEERVGAGAEASEQWREQAREVMRRLNDLSWNGNFYTHWVPLQPFDVPGVDEASQISLSNALALNRGVLERTQARAIVEEYYRRYQQRGDSFAEWYGIHPPFPAGSYGLGGRTGEQPGEYVNGGLLPLVGGELARGAFGVGSEAYGFDILARYTSLITATNSSYLWYYPAGNPGISSVDTVPHDGWGAGAMLAALLEGAAGIGDNGALYNDATLSPRWAADLNVNEAHVVARYAASQGYVAYQWQRGERSITLRCTGSGEQLRVRVLLPRNVEAVAVLVDGAPVALELDDINGSVYVVADLPGAGGNVEVQW